MITAVSSLLGPFGPWVAVPIGLALVYLVHEVGHILAIKAYGLTLAGYYRGFQDSTDTGNFSAKPVLLRMSVILAGPLMNLILCVLCAAGAFRVGVPFTPTEVGGTVPGSPAWEAGLQPGSRIIQIGPNGPRSENLRFDWDLSNRLGLAQYQEDLPLIVREPDREEREYRIRPKMTQKVKGRIPMIGVATANTLRYVDAYPNSPAEGAVPGFERHDKVVAIDGESIPTAYAFDEYLAEHPTGDLRVTVERGDENDVRSVDIVVKANPIKRLGLAMGYGPITGIRPGSPAESAGFRAGDRLETINGETMSDPMSLPSQLKAFYGQTTKVQVSRNNKLIDLEVVPEAPLSMDWTLSTGFPMAAEALGIAYKVTRTVHAVTPGSPAERAGIEPGDTVVGIVFHSENPDNEAKELFDDGHELRLTDEGFDWMFVFSRMQWIGPEVTLTLRYERGGRVASADLKPVPTNEFNPERGIAFDIKTEIHTADSWYDALALGVRQTKEDVMRVARFFERILTGDSSAGNLAGPMTIVSVAGHEQLLRTSRFLMFLTFLSANYALLSCLPIPYLDGGHLIFLAVEGIRGKPVGRNVQLPVILVSALAVCCSVVPCVSQLTRIASLMRTKTAT